MNFDHLKVFAAVAYTKNFTKAAKSLHMSQPSVSAIIRQLEEQLGASLFERTTKTVSLTSSGKLLLKRSQEIKKLVHQTEKELELLNQSLHGNLLIGTSLTIGEHIMPHLLGSYKMSNPNVNIQMKVSNSEQIMDKISTEKVELGFIETAHVDPKFIYYPFLEDELFVISSKEFSEKYFFNSSTLSIEEVIKLPFIIRESGSGTREVIEENLRRHKLDPSKLKVILELEHTESIKSAVEAGIGISVLSKAAIKKELKLGTLKAHRIRGIHFKRYFYIIFMEGRVSHTGESFLEFINNSFLNDV